MKKTPFWGRQHIIESTDRKKVSLTIIPALYHFVTGGDNR